MNTKKRKFSFVSRYDNVPVRGICIIPENPVGILQMVHGMCEHKGRYLSFMKNMAERGYITLMHDCRGHGESLKEKEDIGYCYPSVEKGYIEDVYWLTRRMKKEYPDLPVVLYGHSMGSLAVRAYLRRHDDVIDGLIVSGSPSYNNLVPIARLGLKWMKMCLGERYRSGFLQQVVNGGFESRFSKEHRSNAWLAAKESVAEEFEKDDMCIFTYTLNGFETLLNLEYITYCAGGYSVRNSELPILFVSGKDDPCYINERKWKQSIERMYELGYKHVESIRYEGMRHEIHNEEENEKVYDEIDRFCKKAIAKSCE